MKKELTAENAVSYGIHTHHEEMDNGEKRFRLMSDDGTGYCRTVSPAEPVWQNSHYHRYARELYIVQQGFVLFAALLPDGVQYRVYRENAYFITAPMISHNLYTGENTVLHTVKFGHMEQNDWFPSPDLDRVTKHLLPAELQTILRRFT